ncbi:hypothetical protein, partial [Bacteroides heparinolyticus]|uniref:hypothetical protein n=5 Tax=Bacteroidales TaxID=171549 RepID=UPI0035A01E21
KRGRECFQSVVRRVVKRQSKYCYKSATRLIVKIRIGLISNDIREIGSQTSLSATNAENQQIAKQTPSFTPKNVKSGVFVLFKIIQPLHNKRVAILKESDEKRLIFIYPFSLIFQDFTSS